MTAPSFAGRALLVSASLTFALAFAWWWRTFGEVVRYGYLSWSEAGRCLVGENDICSLAEALCLGSHPRALYAYWSATFWVSAALLSAAFLLNASQSRTPRSP